MLLTPSHQAARKYGKTSHERGLEQGLEQGQLMILQKLLSQRFGALSEDAAKRLRACSKDQLLQLAYTLLTATSLKELGLEP